MVNWWLIVLLVVVTLLCLGIGVYVLFYFQEEDDEEGVCGAKVVVVIGMVFAVGVVLLLPLDVANAADPTVQNKWVDSLDTQLMWQIVMWSLAAMTLVVVPFVMFFYEAYDPDGNKFTKQIAQALFYTIGIFLVFAIVCGVCYTQIGVAIIRIDTYEAYPQIVGDVRNVAYNGTVTPGHVEIGVSFFTYCVGMLCFFGWIVFFFYGGVGLVSFPIDLISGFVNRPKALSRLTFAQEMAIIAAKGDALLGMALDLQKVTRGTVSRSLQRKINILRNEAYILEAQQDQMIWAFTEAGGSPFIVYGKLLLGIVSLGLSVAWVLHIFLYNMFKVTPFLNALLTELDHVFALFGVIGYGVFVFYLMWITFEGQVRLGMRLVFFQIHPLKPHDTTLNSLLFNVSVALLTSFPIVQFAALSFQEYSPRTAVNALMNAYVLQLKGIGYIIAWAQLCLLGISLLSIIWLLMCPLYKSRRDPTKLRLAT